MGRDLGKTVISLWQKMKLAGKLFLASSVLYVNLSCASSLAFQEVPEKRYPLVVHFIDVGNADAHFIETPNKKTILIDGAKHLRGRKIVKYIQSLGYTKIDFVIASHPHSDHIGGLDYVMKKLEVDYVFDNGLRQKNKAYRDYIFYAEQQNYVVVEKDTTIYKDADFEIRIIVPYDNEAGFNENTNDNSILLKLVYKNASFLFTGDLEKEGENDILKDDENIDVNILKIGHHGNRSSTTQEFLDIVSPEIAVIPTLKLTKSNSPHKVVLERLASKGITIYRTDLDGNIIISTDGEEYFVETNAASLEKMYKFLIGVEE